MGLTRTDNTISPQDGAKVIKIFKELFGTILNNLNKNFPPQLP